MAFKAKLTDISRSDLAINVEVEYRDTVTDWSIRRAFNFNNGDTITLAAILGVITVEGQRYKQAIVAENSLKTHINDEITI